MEMVIIKKEDRRQHSEARLKYSEINFDKLAKSQKYSLSLHGRGLG